MLSLLEIGILHRLRAEKRHGNVPMVERLLLLDFHLLLLGYAHLLRHTRLYRRRVDLTIVLSVAALVGGPHAELRPAVYLLHSEGTADDLVA